LDSQHTHTHMHTHNTTHPHAHTHTLTPAHQTHKHTRSHPRTPHTQAHTRYSGMDVGERAIHQGMGTGGRSRLERATLEHHASLA
jgi:hypothetical protein